MPNFRGNKYLCKLGKEYSNASICKFVVYSLQHCETFNVSHVFLPLIIAELLTLKQVRFFLAHPVDFDHEVSDFHLRKTPPQEQNTHINQTGTCI